MRLTMPGLLLRLESAALLTLTVFLYARTGSGWLLFVALILAPDLAALGYLVSVRVGSVMYNLLHTYLLAGTLLTAAWFASSSLGIAIGLIWLTHIGVDRLVGYGLKYPHALKETHLGRV